MNEKDDVLLEYLQDTGSAEPPTVIHWNITVDRETGSFSIDTTRRRLSKLKDLGLVEEVKDRGAYHKITPDGKAYLRGDLDVSKLN